MPRQLKHVDPTRPRGILRARLCASCIAVVPIVGLLGGTAGAETVVVTHPTPGGGAIVSSPSGIACQTFFCEADFPTGSQVTLTATPAKGFAFAGFYDDCTGSSCVLTMDGLKRVRAEFVRFAVQTRSKARRIRATGAAILTVRAAAPGTLVLSGAQVKRQEQTLNVASNVKLEVVAKGGAAKRLRKTGDVKVGVTVTFAPSAGAPAQFSRPVQLHLNTAQFAL